MGWKPNRKRLAQVVREFNAEYPVGSPVRLRTSQGWIDTEVIGAAEVLGGFLVVAWFAGLNYQHAVEGRVQRGKRRTKAKSGSGKRVRKADRSNSGQWNAVHTEQVIRGIVGD